MINQQVVILLYRNALALFCAASIAVSPGAPKEYIAPLQPVSNVSIKKPDTGILIKTSLWQYLKTGLNYLEASGKDVPLNFTHPGGKAYGPLALTPIAIRDVKNHYSSLSRYNLEGVLSDPAVYEKFAFLYADLLLTRYLKIDYFKMPKEEVFEILQKAWFLGPGLYKEGRATINSREVKANEYISCTTSIMAF